VTIPVLGPINGAALLAGFDAASQFRRGHDLGARLGLLRRQHSIGGKTRLLGISKHGNRHLRVILSMAPKPCCGSPTSVWPKTGWAIGSNGSLLANITMSP